MPTVCGITPTAWESISKNLEDSNYFVNVLNNARFKIKSEIINDIESSTRDVTLVLKDELIRLERQTTSYSNSSYSLLKLELKEDSFSRQLTLP